MQGSLSKSLVHDGSIITLSKYSSTISLNLNKYTAEVTDLRRRGQTSITPQHYALVTEEGFSIISEAGVPLITETKTFFFIQYYGKLKKSKDYHGLITTNSTPL